MVNCLFCENLESSFEISQKLTHHHYYLCFIWHEKIGKSLSEKAVEFAKSEFMVNGLAEDPFDKFRKIASSDVILSELNKVRWETFVRESNEKLRNKIKKTEKKKRCFKKM